MKIAPTMTIRSKGLRRDGQVGLLVAMLRFASLISRPMRDRVADAAGFSSNELRILMALSDEGECAGHDLAELMGMHAMNVSRALSSLHAMGLIDQVDNPRNRRRKPHRVNDRGAASYIAMKPHIAQVARFLFGTLSTSERNCLKKILAKLDQRVLQWKPTERRRHVPRA